MKTLLAVILLLVPPVFGATLHKTYYIHNATEEEGYALAEKLERNGYTVNWQGMQLNPLAVRVSWDTFAEAGPADAIVESWWLGVMARDQALEDGSDPDLYAGERLE